MAGTKIVSYIPGEYPRQVGLSCGETNVHAIVSAFGGRYESLPNPPLSVRLFGYSMVQDLEALVSHNGLLGFIRYTPRLSDKERLALLKKCLDKDQPVLLAIGYGYIRRGQYQKWRSLFIGHYITLYGYNDPNEEFYLYDPWLEGDHPEEIPVGNEARTYYEVLRDWRGPIYYGLIGMRGFYMPIKASSPNVI